MLSNRLILLHRLRILNANLNASITTTTYRFKQMDNRPQSELNKRISEVLDYSLKKLTGNGMYTKILTESKPVKAIVDRIEHILRQNVKQLESTDFKNATAGKVMSQAFNVRHKIECKIGPIPSYVEHALISSSKDQLAVDLSCPLSSFPPECIQARIQGKNVEIITTNIVDPNASLSDKSTVQDFFHGSQIYVRIPDNIDANSLRLHFDTHRHQVVLYGHDNSNKSAA